MRLEMIAQRYFQEIGQQLVTQDEPLLTIHLSRRGDASRQQAPRAGLLRRLLRRRQQGVQNGLPADPGPERDFLLGQDFAGKVGQDRADAQRLEVEAQERTVIGVQAHRHRRAPPARRPRVILPQKSFFQEFFHIIANHRGVNVELAGKVEARTVLLAEDQIEDAMLLGKQFRFPWPGVRAFIHSAIRKLGPLKLF